MKILKFFKSKKDRVTPRKCSNIVLCIITLCLLFHFITINIDSWVFLNQLKGNQGLICKDTQKKAGYQPLTSKWHLIPLTEIRECVYPVLGAELGFSKSFGDRTLHILLGFCTFLCCWKLHLLSHYQTKSALHLNAWWKPFLKNWSLSLLPVRVQIWVTNLLALKSPSLCSLLVNGPSTVVTTLMIFVMGLHIYKCVTLFPLEGGGFPARLLTVIIRSSGLG